MLGHNTTHERMSANDSITACSNSHESSEVQDISEDVNGASFRSNDQDNFSNNVHGRLGRINTVSSHSLHDLHIAPPSTLQQKQEATFSYFIKPLGILYAIFLFILSTLIFFNVPTKHADILSVVVLLYIIVSGLIIICSFFCDIMRNAHILFKEEKAYDEELEDLDSGVQADSAEDGRVTTVFRRAASFKQSGVPHDYCFVTGRHAGSTYLKFGTAAFAIGHLVHSIFLVAVQISLMQNNVTCGDIPQNIADILYPLYSFLQLVFVFKYSNVIITKYKAASTLLIIHIIAGNLCLWSMAVAKETELALAAYFWSNSNQTRVSLDDECRFSPVVIKIFQLYSPYLMPFSVEFNLSIVGFFCTILSNIGQCHCRHKNESDQLHQLLHQSMCSSTVCDGLYIYEGSKPLSRSNRDSEAHSHMVNISINCHRSSRGVFTGVALVVFLTAVILLGFLFGNLDIKSLDKVSYKITDSAKLTFHLMMLAAVAIAYTKTRHLDVNQQPTPILDDILLYVCVPAFFIETLFTVIATVNLVNVIKLLDATVMSVQMVLQTSFIIDGLRRCSNSRKLRRTKPGRELVLFLLMTNVAMWILYTLSYKSPQSEDERYIYFGKEFWTNVGHLTVPLIMFYRFHSSVCIAEMWSYAYKPGTHGD